jgi:hypothetical protein
VIRTQSVQGNEYFGQLVCVVCYGGRFCGIDRDLRKVGMQGGAGSTVHDIVAGVRHVIELIGEITTGGGRSNRRDRQHGAGHATECVAR